jgi:geranylgeranyl diphosphate synthase type II
MKIILIMKIKKVFSINVVLCKFILFYFLENNIYIMFNQKNIIYIDDLIKNHIETYFKNNSQIKNICNYVMDNGKRIRSSIIYDICHTLTNNKLTTSILAIEYIHASSLIIDDLPCMDDAKMRRNKDCVHIKYGEAMAQLTSVILLSLAIDAIINGDKYLIDNKMLLEEEKNKIQLFVLNNIGETIGYNGAAGGQMMDLMVSDKINSTDDVGNIIKNISEDIDVDEIIMKKTGKFFESSFIFGWLYGKGDFNHLDKIKELSKNFSMAYQILDDVEDMDEDLLTNKKNINQNYALKFGKEKAIEMYHNYMGNFIKILYELQLNSDFFTELIECMNNKMEKLI